MKRVTSTSIQVPTKVMSNQEFIDWRAEKQYSVAKCARILGVNGDTIERYESGIIRIPRAIYLCTLFDDYLDRSFYGNSNSNSLKGIEDIE